MRAGSVGGGDGGLVKRMAEWRVASEGRESRGVVVGPWDPAPTLECSTLEARTRGVRARSAGGDRFVFVWGDPKAIFVGIPSFIPIDPVVWSIFRRAHATSQATAVGLERSVPQS